MKYLVGRDNIKFNNTVVTLGKFDGIHKGHQLLIEECKRSAGEKLATVLFTFIQNKDSKYIYTEKEKREIVSDFGLDIMVNYPFDKLTRNMEATEFIRTILVDKLGAKKVVVGSDFRFGKNRLGDGELLYKYSKQYGYEVQILEKRTDNDGNEISSTLIRNLILESKMDKVTECLGREYSFKGRIIQGRQLGRQIGFPTINIIPDNNKILPKNGVYSSDVVFEDNKQKVYKAVTNIGNNPTVRDDMYKSIESNIFEFNQDAYGKEVIVYLKEFIRNERKFATLNELKECIRNDIYTCKEGE